jgi:hypothetical protein
VVCGPATRKTVRALNLYKNSCRQDSAKRQIVVLAPPPSRGIPFQPFLRNARSRPRVCILSFERSSLVFGMNAIAGFVADSLVYGPGYSFTAKGPNGATMNWHEAAQAYLQAAGWSAANASLVYSLGAVVFCWVLLWFLWRKNIFLKV